MDHDPGSILTPRRRSGRESSDRPTVLFLDNSFTFGGAIISLRRLVEGLDRLGIDSVVVSGQPRRVMHELFSKDHTVPVPVDVRVPWRHETGLQRLLRDRAPESGLVAAVAHEISNVDWMLRRTIPDALRYARIGSQYDVDLIHLNNSLESQLEGLLVAKLLRVPCIAHARGLQRFSRLVDATKDRIDRHIAISRVIERNLLDLGIPPDDVTVIHDAGDIGAYAEPRDTQSVRRELGIPPEARTFGFVGRMVEWKGVTEFVHAAVRVLEQEPDARALVVGDESDGDHSYFRRAQQLAQRSQVNDRLVFTGYRDDVPTIMQMIDVLVHTSLKPEPFGLVIVDAMAAGKPVVAANRGGPLDIVVDGETGFLVDPEDTDELATSIRRLLENPDLAERMGRAGMQRAKTKFSIKRYARDVAAVYQEVLN